VGSQQQDIIIGTLLGDGFLERNGRNVRLIFDHSSDQSLYVKWKGSYLSSFLPTIQTKSRFDLRTNKYQEHSILRTRTSSELEKYYQIFYRGRKKIIPENLPMMISKQSLAVWIMDDGYKRNDCNALRINSQSYTRGEHEIIISALRKFRITAKIQKHKESFVTYIPSAYMDQLRKVVRPYIIKSMKYKIA
jgi:hypothetical protein